MPGGFHPFHAGHYALYKSALEAFPQADVYVAATNDQSERPFPFSIKEKLAKLAGVAPGRFVQVKSPFQAKEITQNYDPNSDVLIFVRSEKDKNESPKPGGTKKDGSPAYFQPWTGKDLQPFSKHAYFAYLPTVTFGPGIQSATEIRNAWPNLDDRRKTAMVMSLYPATQKNPKLAQNVVQLLDVGMGGQVTEDISRRGFLKGMGAAAVAGVPSITKAYDYRYKKIGSWNIVNKSSKFGDPADLVAFNDSLVYDGRRLYYYIGNGESRPWTKIVPNSLVKYMIDGGKIQNTTSSSTGSVDFTSDISLLVKASKLDIQYTYINLLKRNSDKSEVEIQVSGLGKVIEYFKNPDQYDKKEKFQQDKQDREEKEKSEREAQAKELKRQQDLEVERKRREEEMRPEMERQTKVRKIESDLYQYNKQISANILNNFQQMLGNKLKDISRVQTVDATIQVDKNGNISNVNVGPNAHAESLFGRGGVSSSDRVRMGKDAYDLLKNPKFYNGLFTNIPPDLFQAAMDENGLMTINLMLGDAGGYNNLNKLGGKISIPKLRELGVRNNYNINESVQQGVAEGSIKVDEVNLNKTLGDNPELMKALAIKKSQSGKFRIYTGKQTPTGKWATVGGAFDSEEDAKEWIKAQTRAASRRTFIGATVGLGILGLLGAGAKTIFTSDGPADSPSAPATNRQSTTAKEAVAEISGVVFDMNRQGISKEIALKTIKMNYSGVWRDIALVSVNEIYTPISLANNISKTNFQNLIWLQVSAEYYRQTGKELRENQQGVAEGEEQNVFAPDIETQQLLRYAQQHYPNNQGKQQAFVKFVQRALNHSKEDDMEQDEKIEQLAKAIKQLDAKVSQVTESEDYLEEK